MKKIYVSYSYKDFVHPLFINQLKLELGRAGFAVVETTEFLEPGGDALLEVGNSIRQCSVVIGFISNWSSSVYLDLGFAMGLGKSVITVSEKDVRIPNSLRGFRHVEATDYNSSLIFEIVELVSRDVKGPETQRETIYDQMSFEEMSPMEFESYVAKVFKDRGMRISVNSQPQDLTETDFLLEYNDRKFLICVKRYGNKKLIPGMTIERFIGEVTLANAKGGILICNSDYTRSARGLAREFPSIKLWTLTELELFEQGKLEIDV